MKKIDIVIEELLKDIKNERLAIGDKVPSEYDLAERFSVNRTTANKAVATLVAWGYFKRRRGRGGTYVCQSEIYPLGNIVYMIDITSGGDFKNLLLKGAQNVALREKYALQYLDPGKNYEPVLNLLSGSPILGMLTTGYGTITKKFPFPVIHVDRAIDPSSPNPHCITCDNHTGGYEIAKAVFAAGHRNIVVYSAYPDSKDIQNRLAGITAAMKENGIQEPATRIFTGHGLESINCQNIIRHSFQRKFPGCTAVITTSDPEARKFIHAFNRMGVKVPENVSITGFGNESGFDINITGIEQHSINIGAHACERLIELIQDKEDKIVSDTLSVDFVKGETLATLGTHRGIINY
jgi:DNA-binding LacI/PurR family transcriptional regulator